eukprot:g7712.t1
MLTRAVTMRIANEARDRDRLKFVDYLLDMMRNEAAKGSQYLYITREIVDAGPKTTNGNPVDLQPVCHYLYGKLDFKIDDAQRNSLGFTRTSHLLRNPANTHFPLRVMLCSTQESCEILLEDCTERMATLASAALSKRESNGREQCRNGAASSAAIPISPAMAALVNTLKQGVARAVQYVSDLAVAAFTSGETEYVLTEEVWNQAPKLPNGELPPFWCSEVSDMSPFHIERHVDSVFVALETDGVGLQATEDEEESFPVRIIPVLRT